MSLNVNSDFIIFGKQNQKGFSTNFSYVWEDETPSHQARLYINFAMDSDAIDGEEFAQELFETVRHHYFKNFERDIHERFEETLNEVNKLASAWREEKQSKFFANVHAVIGVVQDATLLLTQCGNAEIYLVRRRHLTLISEELADADKERDNLFVNVASGELEDYDTVIFSTDRLLRYISKIEIAKIFSKDTSFTRAFQSIGDVIETELEGHLNILGLNIVHQKREIENEDTGRKGGLLSQARDFFPAVFSSIPTIFSKSRGVPLNGLDAETEQKIEAGVKAARKRAMNLSRFSFASLKNDRLLMILIAVILILVVGLFVLKERLVRQKELSQLETVLDSVQLSVNEAQTRGTYDKESAIKMLELAEKDIRKVLDSGEFRQRALSLQDEVVSARDTLDNIVKMLDPTLLADFSTKRSTVSILGILPLDEILYGYEYNALYPVMLDKLLEPLSIDATETVIDGVRSLEDQALLFLTKSHKVLKFNDNFVTFLDTQDPAWKGATAIEAYGDRLYLLDPENNVIWKYRKGKERYSVAEEYMTEGDVKGAVDFAIDGAIYVLMKDGSILKYYAGELQTDFKVLRAPMVPVKNATKIFTEAEFTQLYVLEPSAYRLLVYNKDVKTENLVYSHQYQFSPDIGTLKDVFVDKIAKKIVIVTEGKMYQFEM